MPNDPEKPPRDPVLSRTIKVPPRMTIIRHYDTANDMLCSAVHFEDLDTEQARVALDAGADVNATCRGQGGTPLISAAYGSNIALIRLLLERGADVNARGEYGRTALMEAARGGSARVVSALLKHGSDIEARDDGGMTALHNAAADDSPRAIRVLIKAGASVEARDNEGKTPVIHAVHWQRNLPARLLIGNGADVNAKSDNENSVLQWFWQPPPYCSMTQEQWRADVQQSNFRVTWLRYQLCRINESVWGNLAYECGVLYKMLKDAGARD